MYCTKCGKFIDRQDAMFCPFCGEPISLQTNYQQNVYQENPYQNYNQEPYPQYSSNPHRYEEKPIIALVILGFIIPIAGWVIYFIFRHKHPITAKYCGLAGIAGFLFNFLIVML